MEDRVAPRAAGWLSLAAAPTFALMALLSAMSEDGQAAALCTQAGLPAPLAGMVPMYALMAAFHLVPWFGLIARSRER